MMAPIRQVLLQASPFIVKFSTRCLKTSSWTSFIKISPKRMHLRLLWNLFQGFHQLAPWLSTATWKRPLQQDFWLTLLLCSRRSLNDFLLYRVVISKTFWIWPKLLSSRPTVPSVLEKKFKKFSEKISLEYNCSSPKSK